MCQPKAVKRNPNWQLVWFSIIAITRAVLYAVPTSERVPVGLSLMPPQLLFIYGLIWFAVGAFGLFSAVRHIKPRLAHRLIGSMCFIWAVAYVAGAIWVQRQSWAAAAFYALIGAVVLAKPQVEVVLVRDEVE